MSVNCTFGVTVLRTDKKNHPFRVVTNKFNQAYIG